MKKMIAAIMMVSVVLTSVCLPEGKTKACGSFEVYAPDEAGAQTKLHPMVYNCHCLSKAPTGKPKQINIVAKGEKVYFDGVDEGLLSYEDEYEFSHGSTVSVTKGFQLELSLEKYGMYNPDYDDGFKNYLSIRGRQSDQIYYIDGVICYGYTIDTVHKDYNTVAKWTSSNTSIATVDAKGVVTGKKCGKALITAEYDGQTTSVYVNVKENKYINGRLLYPSYFKKASWGTSFVGISSAYFDKKGNLIIVYTDKIKLNKKGLKKRKKEEAYKVKEKIKLLVRNQNGKNSIVTKKIVKLNYSLSKKQMRKGYCKNIKFKIKKSQLKMKKENVDLRTAYIVYFWNY